MPRNGSGVYSLPQPAFVSGTKISSSAMNSDLSDIATALTQSFSADGQTPFTGIFKNADGNASAPSYTFAAETTTGFYRIGTGNIGVTCSGTQIAALSASGVTWNGAQTFSGNITFSSNITFNGTTYTFGAGAVAALYSGLSALVDIGEIIDGSGNVVTTGQRGQIHIPFPMTIQKWWVMGDQSGSVTVDVLRANNGVPSSSIVGGGTAPNLSSSQFASSAPSSWTATTLAKDDFLAFNITGSPSSVQRVSVYLTCLRTG